MDVDKARAGQVDPAIQAAILAAVPEAGGGGRRHFLTGLWLAAVSAIVEVEGPAGAGAILFGRACAIRGQGRNADAPPLAEDAPARERRAAEAAAAAGAIVAALDPLPESEEESFPLRFLDAALALLVEAWGPAHVRRALWNQRTSLDDGAADVILPAEPSASNGQPRPVRPAPVPAPPVPSPAEADPSPAPPAPEPAARPADRPVPAQAGPARRVDAHVDAVMLDAGGVVYALAARVVRGDSHEMREVTGRVRGGGLAEAVAEAVADLLDGMSCTDAVRVTTPVEGALRLAAGDASGLPAGLSGRQVEWAHRPGGLSSELGRRCDRVLRDRIDEEERRGAA